MASSSLTSVPSDTATLIIKYKELAKKCQFPSQYSKDDMILYKIPFNKFNKNNNNKQFPKKCKNIVSLFYHIKWNNNKKLNKLNKNINVKCKNTVCVHCHIKRNNKKLLNICKIGQGCYGTVNMVKRGNKYFALKSIHTNKTDIDDARDSLINEINILKLLNSQANKNQFIVNLHEIYKYSKQSENTLFFLMDLAQGGALIDYLIKLNNNDRELGINQVKFYAACVIEGLEFIHNLNIIYRDLKPENVLIMANGYLKLCDFGMSKILSNKNEKLYVKRGTKGHYAPEMLSPQLKSEGYDKRIDWWCLGIFIYQLFNGCGPFDPYNTYNSDDSCDSTDSCDVSTDSSNSCSADHFDWSDCNDKILNQTPKFDPQFFTNNESIDLIQKLLKKDPNKRLCNSDAIKHHSFFDGFEWEKLQNRTMAPEYVPKIDDNIKYDNTNMKSLETLVAFNDQDWTNYVLKRKKQLLLL